MRKAIARFLVLIVVLGAAYGGYRAYQKLPQKALQVPVAKVRRGDVVIRAYARGELRATRSVTLTAPNLFSTVQVTRLAPLGSMAHEKDLIVEFDDSDRRAQLEETQLEVDQTDEQIKKAEADLAIRNNQDQVDLLRAKYAVRRAELEVKRNPLLAEIDAKKNLLSFEESKRRLTQLEVDIRARQDQAKAAINLMRETRARSLVDMAREKQRIAQAKMLSPMTGLVAVRQNRAVNFFVSGMQLPDIREGDTLQPGMPVADILDLSELEVIARVGELDRANLHEGQEVSMQLDAVPDKRFRGAIKSLSGTASSNVFSGDPAKKFDVTFSIDMKQLLEGLGAKPEQIREIMATAERNSKKGAAKPMDTATNTVPPKMIPGTDIPMPVADMSVDKDRASAKLPPPPEEDSQLSVLLRPGLLADIEITVEKTSDSIYVPNQAVFEKDGKQFVWVENKGAFEQRAVRIAKRSETSTIIAEGLKPNETVALADPFKKPDSKKDGAKKTGGGGATAGMPSGGGK